MLNKSKLMPDITNNWTPMPDIANMAHVKRWSAFHVGRPQSLAEHTVLVTIYAFRLLQGINPNFTDAEAKDILLYALFHDMPESLTGDTPTPTKRWLESKFPKGESPLDVLERHVCPEAADYYDAVKGGYLADIGKLADILDAMHFIGIEGKGPRADVVFKGRMKAYCELIEKAKERRPDLNWEFAHTLRDELLNGQCTEIEFKETF